ncbi:MAG: hypothetical protein DMF74_15685 [Acidobacteria bacterium]|nr:MAG: hypothetical protein DMF74_15685 [Acidobacteriota bacterium]
MFLWKTRVISDDVLPLTFRVKIEGDDLVAQPQSGEMFIDGKERKGFQLRRSAMFLSNKLRSYGV